MFLNGLNRVMEKVSVMKLSQPNEEPQHLILEGFWTYVDDETLSRIESRIFCGSHAQSDSEDDRAILIKIQVKGILLRNEQRKLLL